LLNPHGITVTDQAEPYGQYQLGYPGRNASHQQVAEFMGSPDKLHAVPGHKTANDRGEQVNDDFNGRFDFFRKKPVENGDIDVLVRPACRHCPRQGDPQNQHPEQFVTPDDSDVEEIPHHDLCSGQQDHSGQNDDQDGVFAGAARFVQP
jgi:hypothetical protein